MSRYFVMNSKTKHSVDADAVVDQAVHFVFDSPLFYMQSSVLLRH